MVVILVVVGAHTSPMVDVSVAVRAQLSPMVTKLVFFLPLYLLTQFHLAACNGPQSIFSFSALMYIFIHSTVPN